MLPFHPSSLLILFLSLSISLSLAHALLTSLLTRQTLQKVNDSQRRELKARIVRGVICDT